MQKPVLSGAASRGYSVVRVTSSSTNTKLGSRLLVQQLMWHRSGQIHHCSLLWGRQSLYACVPDYNQVTVY